MAGRSRKGKTEIVQATPETKARARSSMVPVRIGNRTYQAVRDPRCPVCLHPARVQIEEKILLGEGYRGIADWVSEHDVERFDGQLIQWPELTAAQISKHYNANHCPVDARVLHQLQQQYQGELDYEEMTGRVVNALAFADMTIARTQERAIRGEIEPTFREGLAAARLKAQVVQAAADGEREDRTWYYEQAFEIYFTEARNHMTDEQWERFSAAIMTNPVLRQLTERAQQTDVVEAEVVEEQPA